MKGVIRLSIVAMAMAVALPALAQDSQHQSQQGQHAQTGQTGQTGQQGQAGQDGLEERTIDFSDEVVEGELVRPDGEMIEGLQQRHAASLITIREQFIDKMIESAEDL
jgi:uncharacterized protein YdeI (BOF family)